jgi:hypothetical protein
MTTTPMPDSTDIAVDQMDLPAVQVELAGYQPGTQVEVVEIPEHMKRRAQLWARLDVLLGVRRPAIARPVAG